MNRELNCDPKLGIMEKCPECGLFHLRPGYCWKLDPLYPKGFKLGDILEMDDKIREQTVHKGVHAVHKEPELDAVEKRKSYRREWMRKRREGKP